MSSCASEKLLTVAKKYNDPYTPDGFHAITLPRALPRKYSILALTVCAMLVPFAVMLLLRTDESVAEWWVMHIQAGWERALGTITDVFPFSVLELFITLAVVIGIYLFVRLFVNLCKAQFKRIAWGALWLAAALACVLDFYLMSMGFGYYRKPLSVPQSEREYTRAEVRAVAYYFLKDYNALAASLKRDKNGCVVCPYSFDELAALIKREYGRVNDGYLCDYTPRAKPAVFSGVLSSMLITGVTFLPFGEAALNVAAPPTTMTLTVAHELAHTKGVQREGDANTMARYLLLSSSDDYLRYCGYYAAFDNLLSVLYYARDMEYYAKISAEISPLVHKERVYAYNYWQSQPDIIGTIAEYCNDLYLKLSGAKNGTGSYDDGNKTDVYVPIDPDTGEPTVDPDTGEIIVKIEYSQVQRIFFYMYENAKR